MDADKKTFQKGDEDSGLDNTSESGHSGDEDLLAITSDDDVLNSDNESSPPKKNEVTQKLDGVLDSETPTAPVRLHRKKDAFKGSSATEDEVNRREVRIELTYTNRCRPVEEEYGEAIEFFRELAKSHSETVDFSINSMTKKPDWLDDEKFKRGQKFAREHLFCINFAEMVSLFILFAQKAALGPLIFTGKSDSPFTAFKRYLSTLTRLISWYTDDVWSDAESSGKKNMSAVRSMHKNVFQKLTNSEKEELADKLTLGDANTTALWCPMKDLILCDFRETIPEPHEDVQLYLNNERSVWLNQIDMSITQFGFVGLAVTYPKSFGIHVASDDDLDAFLHMWRGFGYLLGIKDEYNYCNTNLEGVRRRTKLFVEAVAKPAFREVTCDWEHMCRCLTAGIAFYVPQVNFESAFLYLCHLLNIRTPRLKKQVSFRAYILFQLHRLVFYLMRFPVVLRWLNSGLYECVKKAQNVSPETLTKWENKEFEYKNQPGKCPIRGQYTSQNL